MLDPCVEPRNSLDPFPASHLNRQRQELSPSGAMRFVGGNGIKFCSSTPANAAGFYCSSSEVFPRSSSHSVEGQRRSRSSAHLCSYSSVVAASCLPLPIDCLLIAMKVLSFCGIIRHQPKSFLGKARILVATGSFSQHTQSHRDQPKPPVLFRMVDGVRTDGSSAGPRDLVQNAVTTSRKI